MHPPFDDLAWAALVEDLDASARADRDGMVRELSAAYAAEVHLHQRLAGAVGAVIRVRLAPCPELEGTLMRVGRDHLWVADAHGYWVVVTAELDGVRVAGIKPIPAQALSPSGERGLASGLRELVGIGRSISALVGDRWVEGTLTRVGADFVEIADLALPLARIRACRVWY